MISHKLLEIKKFLKTDLMIMYLTEYLIGTDIPRIQLYSRHISVVSDVYPYFSIITDRLLTSIIVKLQIKKNSLIISRYYRNLFTAGNLTVGVFGLPKTGKMEAVKRGLLGFQYTIVVEVSDSMAVILNTVLVGWGFLPGKKNTTAIGTIRGRPAHLAKIAVVLKLTKADPIQYEPVLY